VLVRVHASSANPAGRFGIAHGDAQADGNRLRVSGHLGRDYAGVVEQVGNNVSRYAVGDEVFGFVLHWD
jgi:NADPH:quinone reductase-like Zn-dependent oxidoreductase